MSFGKVRPGAIGDPFDITLANPKATLVGETYYTNDATLDFVIPTGTTVRYELYRIENGAYVRVYSGAEPPPTQTTDGTYELQAVVTDGTTDRSFFLAFILDTVPPAAPVVSLVNDTGVDTGDRLTNDPTLQVVGAEGEVQFYLGSGEVDPLSLDAVNAALAGRSGPVTVRAVQTDLAGNRSVSVFSFTIDRDPPDAPAVAVNDDQSLDVAPPADAVRVLYSWRPAGSMEPFSEPTDAPPSGLPAGTYDVEVRVEDAAGNRSAVTTVAITATGLNILPLPTAALASDSGSDSNDSITNTPTLLVEVDDGNVAEFSYDGGDTWVTTQRTDLADGTITVLVRQITLDTEGNVIATSAERTITFTLDTTVAVLDLPPTVDLDTWLITGTGGVTFTGQEAGAVIEFSTDGETWTTTRPTTGLEDGDQIWIRQTDLAGNISDFDIVAITAAGTPVQPNDAWFPDPNPTGPNSGLF